MTTETLATGSESTFLYRFLVSPDLRWMRYLVLILVLGTISFNQVFIIFLDYKDILGGWIYTFTFLYLLTYVAVIYLNLFQLFPKYLLKRHYLTYLSLLSAAMIVALLIQMSIEYMAYSYWLSIRRQRQMCIRDSRSSVDTDVNRIHGIFLLAGTPCARFLFFDAHGSGLYFFFYVIYAVYDRRYDDSSPEGVDD